MNIRCENIKPDTEVSQGLMQLQRKLDLHSNYLKRILRVFNRAKIYPSSALLIHGQIIQNISRISACLNALSNEKEPSISHRLLVTQSHCSSFLQEAAGNPRININDIETFDVQEFIEICKKLEEQIADAVHLLNA